MAGLSYLTAHSLDEDAYGVVQRDVPRVLEALLSFTAALEAYTQELENLTSASQLNASEAAAEGSEEEKKQYLERRRRKESEAIGELVGPLLTGELCLSHFAVGRSGSSDVSINLPKQTRPWGIRRYFIVVH
jgi:nucleoporin NDC1